MKCPKCAYLGFETGDRCRNCGYDFSLIGGNRSAASPPELYLRGSGADGGTTRDWLAQAEAAVGSPAPESENRAVRRGASVRAVPRPRSAERGLPLFAAVSPGGSDEPLIRLRSAPRPPLAVRRTPDAPRFRPVPKPVPETSSEPALTFDEDVAGSQRAAPLPVGHSRLSPVKSKASAGATVKASGPVHRIGAALLDLAILGVVDTAVVYFTLRMTGLSLADWAALPKAPLLGFLVLVKLAYFVAFTAVGGQTIGKMAAGIRVVAEDGTPVDAVVAVRRTLAGAVSAAALGIGFALALFDPQHRALHDRVARTRVIGVAA